MKKIFLILTLFISLLTNAQITTGTKISAMPNYTGNVDSAYVPIIIGGVNKKTQAYNVNKHRIDSLVGAVGAGISQWGSIGGTLSNQSDLQGVLNGKQATLVSGTNIKTVNSNSLVGSGNVAVQDVLVSGTSIKTINSTSLLGSGNISVVSDPTTTTGDIIYRNSSGVLTRLGIGTSGQLLAVSSGIPAWSTLTFSWGGKFNSVGSFAGPSTLTTTPAIQYTGTGGHTLTLPSLSGNSGQQIAIKNAGSGNVTIARAGSDVIYTSSSVTSVTLTPGQSILLVAMNSTTWQGFFLTTAGDASNLTTGTLADARLSANVPLLNASNTFTATNTFNSATITGSLGFTPATNARTITIQGAGAAQDLTANRTFYPKPVFQQVIEALGSEIKGQSVGVNMDQMSTTAFDAADGTVYWTAVWVPSPTTLTGIKFWLGQTGVFTGDNFNGFGLYTYSAGTLTQVAITANDENIWKGTAGNFQSVPFTSTYSASAGLYYVAFVYNNNQVTTPTPTTPRFGISASVATGGMQSGDFTNSAKLNSTHTGQTALPSTRLMSALTVTTLRPWIGVY